MTRAFFYVFVIIFTFYKFSSCDNTYKFAIGALYHPDDYETEAIFEHGIIQANQDHRYDFLYPQHPGNYGSKHRLSRDAEEEKEKPIEENNEEEPLVLESKVHMPEYQPKLPYINFIPNILNVSKQDSFKTGKLACEMTESGIAAIFGPESLPSSGIVQSICTALEIPHVQTNWNPSEAQYSTETVINFYPYPRSLSKNFADLVRETSWKSYIILYENEDGLVRLQDVMKLNKQNEEHVVIRQLGEGPDYRTLLKEVELTKIVNIILDCERDRVIEILSQAKEVHLLKDYYNYILTSLDAYSLDFGTLFDNKPNITVMTMIEPQSSLVSNFVADLQSYARRKSLQITPKSLQLQTALTHDALTLFTRVLKEMVKTQHVQMESCSCDDQPIRKWMHGLLITENMKLRGLEAGLTGKVEFDYAGRRRNYTLHVVQISPKEVVNGKLTPNGYESLRSDLERQTEIYENIHQKLFRVASRIGRPYLIEKKPNTGLRGNDRYEGYTIDLLTHIARILNFTFEFYVPEDSSYGSLNPKTKEWNGLIKELLTRNADLAICDLTITYERRQVVDFTMPFMTLGISILYSKQAKQPPDLFSFTSPLSTDVWLYMATAFLCLSFLIYFITRMSPDDWENPHPCVQEPEALESVWTFKNCLWLSLGSIMQQGCDILPKGISTRMVTGMWWFFSLILLSSYTANLAAFLTNERMGPTIESAEDLAKQSKIKYGLVHGGSTMAFFTKSNFSTYQRMWTAMEQARPSVFTTSNDEGVERVLKGKNGYAFLMESTSIEYEVERNCDLRQVGGLLDTKGYGIAMPVNSPYRTTISQAVLKLQEDGVLHRLKEKWWKEKYGGGSCNKDKKASDQGSAELDIANVGGVFVVLIGGMFLALIIAILEFLWNVRRVAVDEQLTVAEAFRLEMKFVLNIFVTKKAAKSKMHDSDNGSETRSIAQSVLRTFNMELFGNEYGANKR